MPNHLHILVRLLDKRPVEKVMGQFHSFTGHSIIDRLKKNGMMSLLHPLELAGQQKGDRDFLVWEDSLARCVETEQVLLETIEYIHNNPCSKNWHLVENRADYGYSSACFYDRGERSVIDIDHYLELLGGTPSF